MSSYEANIKKTLELLLNTSGFLTLSQLSDKLNISKRSVQNYLLKIEDWFLENGFKDARLIKRRGSGIMLDVSSTDNLNIRAMLGYGHINVHTGDAKRRMEITRMLLLSEEEKELTIKNLSYMLHVSRSVILCDLEWVGQWLERYKVRLFKTQHKGIRLFGGEISYRNAIAGFLDSYESDNVKLIAPVSKGRLSEENLKKLLSVYPREDIMKVAKIIEAAEQEYDFFLMDDYFISLLTHIIISLSRILGGKPVDNEFLPIDEDYPPLETETAEYISSRIESAFNIKLAQAEKLYICIHLVGYNAFSAEPDMNPSISPKIENLASEIIKLVDKITDGNYIDDKMLFCGLCFHLTSTIYCLKKGIYYTPINQHILPENAMEIYNAVKEAEPLYKRICDITPDHDELLYVTYYFLLSKKRNIRKANVLLVCNKGIAARMELHKFLEVSLRNVNVSDNCTTYQLPIQPEREYDFIITTEPIKKRTKPVIDLSKLDRSEYIKCIEKEIF